jgi:hypothetical protein
MPEEAPGTRLQLIRDVAVLQLKLLVDSLRDAMLVPVSITAAVLGLLRGGEQADLEFQRVLELGRRTERWINLFGDRPAADRPNIDSSLDHLLERVESVVLEQYRKGRDTESARAAISAALEEASGDKPGNSGKSEAQ